MNSSDVRDLIISCLLPELKQDLDSIPIEKDTFKEFHKHLEMHLPLLYDCIQRAPMNFLRMDEQYESKKEMLVYLGVLLFEITSPNSIYKLNQLGLIRNAEIILQNYSNLPRELDDLIFKYYENKLDKDNWKKQLGAVHGFVQYLQARDNIISMNIHSVIYDAVLKDIYILDSICMIVQQWNCLMKCLDFYENFDSFTWNYLDDMMEILLRNISLSPDSASSLCLLKFVNKLIVYFTINHMEYDEFFNDDLTLMKNLNEYRSLATTNTSYTCYRWAKDILQMFVIESYKLMQTLETAKQMLQEIHKIYILAILPIRVPILEPHLIIFLDKYIPVLMEAVKVHKYQEGIMQSITSLLETFQFHLKSSESSSKVFKFKENIYALLKTEYFKNYASK